MGSPDESKTGEDADHVMRSILSNQIAERLLDRSNLTRAQFETVLIDQLGEEMANRMLTRDEMARLRQTKSGISRGAFNRTLGQARTNVSEAIYTILLLGYAGLLQSPSLAPFVEASERLRSQADELKRLAGEEPSAYSKLVAQLLDDIEEAFASLHGRERDM